MFKYGAFARCTHEKEKPLLNIVTVNLQHGVFA